MSDLRYCDDKTSHDIERKTVEKCLSLLDRPDCKTAREIIQKQWTTYELKRTTAA